MCGGSYKNRFTRELNAKNEEGDILICSNMTYGRSKIGLGGAGQYLASVGGFNGSSILQYYEKYLI